MYKNPTVVAIIATMALTSACGGRADQGRATSLGLTPLAQTTTVARDSTVEAKRRNVEPAVLNKLYVANESGNDVAVYSASGPFQYKINDAISKPDALAVDSSENLYVANLGGVGSVDVFYPGAKYPEYGISLFPCPNALAIGPGGDFYVADSCNNIVYIWSLTDPSQDQALTFNIQNPQALAFDGKGVLYVANGSTSKAAGYVAVCTGSPPTRSCGTKITSHIENPHGLAVDRWNYLFVANDVTSGNVTKYKPYSLGNDYVNTWGAGDLDNPNALVFDSLGHLCASSPGNAKVACYTNPTVPFKIITNGIGNPTGMAVGPSDYLNVSNFVTSKYPQGSITQYCSSATCINPANTITSHIDGPSAVQFGP